MPRMATLLFLLLLLSSPIFAVSAMEKVQSPAPWYENFIFSSNTFSLPFIQTLGYAVNGGADIGESIITAKSIHENDIDDWSIKWSLLGDRIEQLADKLFQNGDMISARDAYFRASNYFRTSAIFLDHHEKAQQLLLVQSRSKMDFMKALSQVPEASSLRIPYNDATLPAYFFEAKRAKSPLLILVGGMDTWPETLYFQIGKDAFARGYHVLIFEGPGQGEVMRDENLAMIPDYEKVVKAAIDYTLTLSNIDKDKIAVMGTGMGSYSAARACANDARIKACIFNDAIFDIARAARAILPETINPSDLSDPEKLNKAINDMMQKDIRVKQFYDSAMWSLNVDTPVALLTALQNYSLESSIKQIKAPSLVVESSGDIYHQAQLVFDGLTAPKAMLNFNDKDAVSAPAQSGGLLYGNAMMLNWLNNTLNFNQRNKNEELYSFSNLRRNAIKYFYG